SNPTLPSNPSAAVLLLLLLLRLLAGRGQIVVQAELLRSREGSLAKLDVGRCGHAPHEVADKEEGIVCALTPEIRAEGNPPIVEADPRACHQLGMHQHEP